MNVVIPETYTFPEGSSLILRVLSAISGVNISLISSLYNSKNDTFTRTTNNDDLRQISSILSKICIDEIILYYIHMYTMKEIYRYIMIYNDIISYRSRTVSIGS